LFAERLAQNIELLELEEITQLQFDDRKLENMRVLHEKITRIQKQAAKRDLTFATMTAKAKTSLVLGEAVRLSSGVAQNSKTMFKINKASALAQASAELPAAVISSFKNAGGYPWGLIPAGLMLATGLAQIQAIKSTTFSGGGAGTTPSLAGGSPTINSNPLTAGGIGGSILPSAFDVGAGPGGTRSGQEVTIRIDGLDDAGLMTTDQVRALMSSISEQIGDGVTINTGG